MHLKKEAIKGDSQAVQQLIDSLAEEVSFSQWPGEVELGGSIQSLLEGFLNDAFSIDYPEINNSLKVFNRVSTARRLLDTLSSIEPVWLVNNTQIDKSNSWSERIDKHLSVPKTFSDTLPVTLRLNSLDYTIVEYNGTLRVGGNYRKDKENFGISMKLDMVLKYANAEDFYVKLDPHTTDRFQNLDLDSRKLEYSRIKHTPFTSLYKFGRDLPLFRKTSTEIKLSNLATLAILSHNGNIEGSLDSIKGEPKKTASYFKDNSLYTVVEIEGLKVWDGKVGDIKSQPRLLQTLIEEVSTIPDFDSFTSVQCDIQVFVYDSSDQMLYKQLATLKLNKVKLDFCGTIINEGEVIKKEAPSSIDLERLAVDNTKIKDIQDKFEDRITRSITVTYDPSTKDFDLSVLGFLKELPQVSTEDSKDFVYHCYLDKDATDILSSQSLDLIKGWKEFKSEIDWYDYADKDDFIFYLDMSVSIPTRNKEDEILKYTGTLAIEPESKIKTNLTVSLKAMKLNSTRDRDYKPKSPVNRYADLDLD